jgi:hypothetical protein
MLSALCVGRLSAVEPQPLTGALFNHPIYQTIIALKSNHFKANGNLVMLQDNGDRSTHSNYHHLYGCRILLKRWQALVGSDR